MAPHAETRTVRAEATETLKVLVLETDDVFPETRERKGTFGQIFHALFEKAGKQHNPPLKLETTMMFVVEPEGGKVPDTSAADGFHAVLFSGSKHDAHGDDEWILKLVKWIQGVSIPYSVATKG